MAEAQGIVRRGNSGRVVNAVAVDVAAAVSLGVGVAFALHDNQIGFGRLQTSSCRSCLSCCLRCSGSSGSSCSCHRSSVAQCRIHFLSFAHTRTLTHISQQIFGSESGQAKRTMREAAATFG